MLHTVTAQTRYETQAVVAYRELEARIVSGELPPGIKLSAAGLAVEIGCGRAAVRDAIQMLRHDGFLETRADGKTIVTPINASRQLDLLEVRRPLETLLTQLGIARSTADQRRRMNEVGERYLSVAVSGGAQNYLAANRAAMDIRMEAANNPVLADSMRIIFGISRRFWFRYIEDRDNFYRAAKLHSEILFAISAGDLAPAVDATNALLDFLKSMTLVELARIHANQIVGVS